MEEVEDTNRLRKFIKELIEAVIAAINYLSGGLINLQKMRD